MEKKSSNPIRVLQIYSVVLTIGFVIFYIAISRKINNLTHFKEINVERINIIEKDGKLKMVISNHANQHPGSVDGKLIEKRDRPAGIIFFNDEGDECGGLVYDGNKKGAGMVFSVDQYKNDQIMQLQYNQKSEDKERSTDLMD